MKQSNITPVGSVVSAIAASLCCITPVLALVAGTSGIAATFSWLEPARPYLIGTTFIALGFAWYQKLRTRKADEIECGCEEDKKPSFLQSTKFLAIVTVSAAIMLAFPYYANIFYPEAKANVVIVNSQNIQQIDLEVSGMTCTACEEHVKHAVAQLPGFIEASADYKEGRAVVKFDKSNTTIEDLVSAINETGYKVTHYQIDKN